MFSPPLHVPSLGLVPQSAGQSVVCSSGPHVPFPQTSHSAQLNTHPEPAARVEHAESHSVSQQKASVSQTQDSQVAPTQPGVSFGAQQSPSQVPQTSATATQIAVHSPEQQPLPRESLQTQFWIARLLHPGPECVVQHVLVPAQSEGQLLTDSVSPQQSSLQLSWQGEYGPHSHSFEQVRVLVAHDPGQDPTLTWPGSHCLAPQSAAQLQEFSFPVQ